jgi:4-hydroxythreonine-4-phosphate dehydrogenase
MSPHRPQLALTCGEPAGIGPDLCVAIAEHLATQSADFDVHLIGDAALLEARAAQLGCRFRSSPNLAVVHRPLAFPVDAGKLDTRNARWVIEVIDHALQGCQSGRFDAMVTAPVQKSIINDAGIPFSGHTEYLAQQCNVATPVMLLAADALRVALATTHLPLAQVSATITGALLDVVIDTLHRDLRRWWAIETPRMAVCGLNPHAGEGGYLGREEIDTIAPAIARAQARGLQISGPWPADTLFTPRQLQRFDVVLAMYHDQGLPVLKHAGFGNAVNVTLGLPIIRTSVDHGTALDLAGSGKAEHASLLAALQLAATLTRRSATA